MHVGLDVHGESAWDTGWCVAVCSVCKGHVLGRVLDVGLGNIEAGGEGHDVLVGLFDLGIHTHELTHGMVVDLVGEDNVAVVGMALLANDTLVIGVDGSCGLGASREDVPVVRVIAPDNGAEAEGMGDGTDAVVSVAERRTPAAGSDADDVLDDAHGVEKLGKDLLVGQSGHIVVGPCVDADIVAVSESALSLERIVEHVGADEEHCSLEFVAAQEVIEGIVGTVWSVVKGKAPGAGLGALGHVVRDAIVLWGGAARRGPPAIRVSLGV